MSDTIASLNRQITSAGDLQSVVRTMKALAASSIGQYEKSVSALGDYTSTVELGLGVCLRARGRAARSTPGQGRPRAATVGTVVFGSDQGLVGQFNDIVADFAIQTLAALPGRPQVWAVGERVHARLTDAGVLPVGLFAVPGSVEGITPLIGQIQLESEVQRSKDEHAELYVFYNQTQAASGYAPVCLRLLPLDASWMERLTALPWPAPTRPETVGDDTGTLRALIREYLFISLFRACAESLASENASRLAAMQRADKNIDDLLETLHRRYHQMRQSGIDEELFDVISGFEALAKKRAAKPAKRVRVNECPR